MDMKISSAVQSYDPAKTGAVKNAAAAAAAAVRRSRAEEQRDSLALSSHAKDYHTALKALKEIPDIRTDRVEALKAQIQAGTYHVSAADIADRMLGSRP